jgi:hypothetical protein
MKRFYRFFGGLLDSQEKWLNQMSQKGYRLIKAGKISYEFEECRPGEYQYAVEYDAQQSMKGKEEYRAFLEELGCRVFYKNVNLNFSIGKMRWRPYGGAMGRVSASPGSYNKEILIIEKKNDGKPFELHTTNADKADYYKPLRNAWLSVAAIFLVFAVWRYIDRGSVSSEAVAFGILALLFTIPVVIYQMKISSLTSQSKIEE